MIKVEDLRFAYGSTLALDAVTFDLTAQTTALLGPNGAGKSTLLRLLSTVTTIQDGLVMIGDMDLRHRRGRSAARRRLGFMPQRMELPGGYTAEEFLCYAAWMHGVGDLERAARAALELVDLIGYAGAKIKTLSGGMRQRLCVAQAVVHRPSVLIIDEPTVGLDPQQRVQLRQQLSSLECQVVLATHMVDDVAAMADDVAVLERGRLLFRGSVTQLCAPSLVSAESVEAGYLNIVGADA